WRSPCESNPVRPARSWCFLSKTARFKTACRLPRVHAEDVGKAKAKSTFGGCGGQRKSVQHATHAALQRLVDQLVLLDAGLAGELLGDHVGGEMIAVAGEVPDGDLRVGKARLDEPRDLL